MAKQKPKPQIVGGLPADREIIRKCQMLLATREIQDETALELAEWIVNNVRLPKLSGPEIAAMVDDWAVRRAKTIAQAAEIVCDLLNDQFSVEAILQAHKRYGRTSGAIRDDARHMKLQHQEMDAADAEMSDDERAEMAQLQDRTRQKIERLDRAWREYVAAKKDISG